MAEGRVFYIRTHADFPERFALVLPSFWEIEDKAEEYRALTAANEEQLLWSMAAFLVYRRNFLR